MPDKIVVSEFEMLLAAKLFVLKRAISALIISHPDPAGFAERFNHVTTCAQIDHAIAPKATERVRSEARGLAEELLGLAQDEITRRRQQKGV